MDRSTLLKGIRPEIPRAEIKPNTQAIEAFQNQTLRPILKFQHDLLIAIVDEQLKSFRSEFHSKSDASKRLDLERIVQKDLRKLLLGLVIGHFSLDEYAFYKGQQREIHKRIIGMMVNRLFDGLTSYIG